MLPVLLVLDDWEGRIAASACWERLKGIAEVRFLTSPLSETPDIDLADVACLMAIRERTTLSEDVFARLPSLKLILQTGGHAYHIDTQAAARRGINVALGRRATAPLLTVPELTIAMMLNLSHLLPRAQQAMKTGGWPLLTGRTLNGLALFGMFRRIIPNP